MLWVDKHRPSTLSKLSYHEDITHHLQALASNSELPHLLFYGPSGAGKKTRVMALLREIFGGGVEKLRLDHRTFTTPSQRKVEITTIASNYHIECNPADVGNNDRFVVQEVIKEIASSHPVVATGAAASFKVVILTEVDRLTKQAQAALRRTMEKYSTACRLILICNSPSKIIEPVRSRCLGIRVPAPSVEQMVEVMNAVVRKEGLRAASPELLARIAVASQRNLRRALLMLEACRVQNPALSADQPVQLADWELYINQLAREILSQQSPQKLLRAREMLYELLTNCVPATVILQTLVRDLMKMLDDELKHQVAYWAAFYEHRINLGSKEIYHLEAFIAKFMSLYKHYLVDMFL